jgi:hypothetical protein
MAVPMTAAFATTELPHAVIILFFFPRLSFFAPF